jgi:fructose-bisphosphate aldolase class 1
MIFNELCAQRVTLEGMILKPQHGAFGIDLSKQESVAAVADATVM